MWLFGTNLNFTLKNGKNEEFLCLFIIIDRSTNFFLFEILFLLMFQLELPEIYILTSPFLHISKSCFFGPIASVRTNISPGPHMFTIGEIFFRKMKFDIQLNALETNRVQNFSEIVSKMVDQKSASANFTIKKSVTSCNSSSPCFII